MNIEQITARIANPSLQTVAIKSTNVAAAFAAKVNAINADKALTTVGKSAAINAALPAAIRDLAREGRELHAEKSKVAARRAAIAVQPLAKDDIVGFLADSEYRALFRTMDRAERVRLLLETKDAGLLAAALRAAPELSGIGANEEQFAKQIESHYFEMTAGPALAEIADMEAELAEADAFYRTARYRLQSLADMDERNFARIAGPIEKQTNAPWIKRDGARVMCVEVDTDGKASYREATNDEVANGVEYKDFEAYQDARAAA